MKEIWKDIPGYEGLYQASTLGRIRSLDRYVKHWRGGNLLRKGIILKPGKACGYPMVILCKEGSIKYITVHVLVLKTFIGPCPKGKIARHFPDRTKTNCRLDNLQWGTPMENQDDRSIHGTDVYLCGEAVSTSKLTEKQVDEIKDELLFYEKGDITKLAKEYNVSLAAISLIRHKKTWKHV